MHINHQFIVGLCGGIGSGKTTVSNQFQSLGINVVDADIIAHKTTELGQPVLVEITNKFGQSALLKDGNLNRGWLRQRIFEHPKDRYFLEGLLHPLINEKIQHELSTSQSEYTLLVSPLLLNSSLKDICNRILVVECSREQQINRVQARDQSNKQTINAIIDAQASYKERQAHADDVIDNSLDLEHLIKQVNTLHSLYLNLAVSNNR